MRSAFVLIRDDDSRRDVVLAKVGGIEREEPGLPIPSRAVDAPFVGMTRKAAAKRERRQRAASERSRRREKSRKRRHTNHHQTT